jgi:hypothetical protein
MFFNRKFNEKTFRNVKLIKKMLRKRFLKKIYLKKMFRNIF